MQQCADISGDDTDFNSVLGSIEAAEQLKMSLVMMLSGIRDDALGKQRSDAFQRVLINLGDELRQARQGMDALVRVYAPEQAVPRTDSDA